MKHTTERTRKVHTMSNVMCIESFTLANGETVTCDRKAAPKNSVLGHEQVCHKCFEAWMMENSHNDEGHADPVDGCPACGTYDPRQGHTKTKGTKQVHHSHANCNHDKTPVARAKCRKARNKGAASAPEVNAEPVNTAPMTQEAYDALTDKQRSQALAVIAAEGIAFRGRLELVQSLTLALVERARAKKTTVAKLSKGDIRNVIAIDSL
ncbi:hypothetical protein SEA_MSCARN_33 [Gordonia phage MScarn]|uniref:Uncharacterized protein n=1 Tax=Gordonia phage MScarn TaxID=2836043 RepID=A0A8F3EA09_9CAUD|nr:hypothetical protein SEA_MSCARN_33 [Gordonia phage MScarn]